MDSLEAKAQGLRLVILTIITGILGVLAVVCIISIWRAFNRIQRIRRGPAERTQPQDLWRISGERLVAGEETDQDDEDQDDELPRR